ncbi:hypothetical protein CQA62_05005 [Helicobacter cholecystus]|uniref:Uncharacterized protein n=1 Tax=Helicobacter cholecystus TaxID=45498 RepID=A0A3D8IUL0_9HELI|nr:hypothetical protein [Helicobacter cholecystus]RDU68958.1 hypothetical protein CQA62_05005 [Helicobacter cholecystus]
MKKKVIQGFNLLSKGVIREASQIFSEQYFLDPNDLDSQYGKIFCDISMQNFGKGVGLGDYYFMRRKVKKASELVQEMEIMLSKINEIENFEVQEALKFALYQAESLECITLDDFKKYIATQENFKEAFEDFNFSTKIVFFNKDELCEFLNLLIEKGLPTLTLQYAEAIGANHDLDPRIYNILQKAVKQSNESK